MSQTVEKLISSQGLDLINDPVEQQKIFSTAISRIAAGLEAQHLGHEAGEKWGIVAINLENIVKLSPSAAFQFAVDSLDFDKKETQTDSYGIWLQGNGLTILTFPNIKPLLVSHLNSPKSEPLKQFMSNALKYPIPDEVQDKDDLSDYPQCYNLTASLAVLDSVSDIFPENTAIVDQSLQDSGIQRIIGLYHQISDTKALVEPLWKKINPSL